MGTAPEQFEHEICDTIRAFAMTFPEANEGTSCVNRAFKAGKKNFAFLGEKGEQCTLRLKLSASIDDVTDRSSTDERFEVGTGGWTKIVFAASEAPDTRDLKTWITESFLLLAPKKVAAQFLPE